MFIVAGGSDGLFIGVGDDALRVSLDADLVFYASRQGNPDLYVSRQGNPDLYVLQAATGKQ